MATRQKKRNKSEPTTGDKLHQAYRNRSAMQRVFEGAVKGNRNVDSERIQRDYWQPRDMNLLARWEVN